MELLEKIKERIWPERPSVEVFTFHKNDKKKKQRNGSLVDTFKPSLTRKGSSRVVTIPMHWIRITRLFHAIAKALKLDYTWIMELEKTDEPIWGHRIVIYFKKNKPKVKPENEKKEEVEETEFSPTT